MTNMNFFHLEIKKPLSVPKNPKNKYAVVLSFMHGDGDQYEDSGPILFDALKADAPGVSCPMTLNTFLNVLHNYFTADWNSKCGMGIDELAKITGLKEDSEELDYFNDLIPGDCTADGQFLCMIDGMDIFWYDDAHIKHAVEVPGMQTVNA